MYECLWNNENSASGEGGEGVVDFTAKGILKRLKSELKNEDTKIEGSFSMDNLQAVSEEIARLYTMRMVPLINTLTDKEDDMGTSGNERHYERWAKEATDEEGNIIAGSARVYSPRDGTGFVYISILTVEAKPPTEEQVGIVQSYIDTKRPVGADPIVSAAEGIEIIVQCDVHKVAGYTKETVKSQIKSVIEAYLTQIAFQREKVILNYYTVSNKIDSIESVKEIVDLTIDGEKDSISTDYDKYFTLKELNINVIE